MRKGMVKHAAVGGGDGGLVAEEIDLTKLRKQERELLMESTLKGDEEDNDSFLLRFRERIDRVGVNMPKIEVRYEHLSVVGEAHVGHRALPTLANVTMNAIESVLRMVHLAPSNRRSIQILKDVSGIAKPSRMTLLLGPPGAGKTTLLRAIAGKLDDDLKKTGKVKYCGHEFHEFVPQKTCAYISHLNLHHGEMTVRETLDFSGRCLGVGTRYELLAELSRREKQARIKPEPELDAFLKSISVAGQKTSLVTDYIIKILGLDICADIIVGDEMRRGISGGQKKRLTTGEMLVGPAKVVLMDEISTGLDSSTTFQIVKYMRQLVHIMDVTMVISLLQPTPETYDLFDDIILLSERQIVYQGPKENVVEFFEKMGFKYPTRKGIADFLQEVTSKNDQEQYWFRKEQAYRYISATEFTEAFTSFHLGKQLAYELSIPYDKPETHPAALVKRKYGISNWELLKACFSREWLLMKRNSFVYIFKTCQITILSIFALSVFLRTQMPYGRLQDGRKFYGALFYSLINVMFNGMVETAMTVMRLPVFFKQRDHLFYPAWAFCLPIWFLKIPLSFIESAIWVIFTYYSIGFAPSAGSTHQAALSLFRFIAAIGKTLVVSNTLATFTLLLASMLSGFIIAYTYGDSRAAFLDEDVENKKNKSSEGMAETNLIPPVVFMCRLQ
nr:pleiotropic drug resistance protein 2 [Ipomoea batatas]